MEKVIKIKYLNDKIEKLTYIDGKSDWIMPKFLYVELLGTMWAS